MKFILRLCLCLLSVSFLAAEPKDFYLLTIPKSGTHLTAKLMLLLTGKQQASISWPVFAERYRGIRTLSVFYDPELHSGDEAAFEQFVLNLRPGVYPHSHLHIADLWEHFSVAHPNYVKIVQVRDLRDVLVSYVHMHRPFLEQEVGSTSFDDLLLFVINMAPSQTFRVRDIINMRNHAAKAAEWVHEPDVLVLRFEDLVGASGHGDQEIQGKTIRRLAKHLNIPLDKHRLKYIQRVLFGNTKGPRIPTTFREGIIGGWTRFFKPRHIAAFNENFGSIQTALGYGLN